VHAQVEAQAADAPARVRVAKVAPNEPVPARAATLGVPGVRVVIEMIPPSADCPNASGDWPR
jgi:hypothetical protein